MGEYGGKRVVETEAGKWAGMFKKLRKAEKRQGNIKLASNLYTCLNEGSM